MSSLTSFFQTSCGITPEEKQLSVSGKNWGEVDLNGKYVIITQLPHFTLYLMMKMFFYLIMSISSLKFLFMMVTVTFCRKLCFS